MGSGWRGGHDKLPLHFEETFASLINERGSRLDEKEVKADLRGQWDNGTKVPDETRSRGMDVVMAISWQRTKEAWLVPEAKNTRTTNLPSLMLLSWVDILFVPPNMAGVQRPRPPFV